MEKQRKTVVKNVAQNRKAHFNFFIEEKFECGIVLTGTEIKSLRLGKCNISEAYASINDNEIFIKQMHISPYEQGNIFNKDPLRARKLLLHKKEIRRIAEAVAKDGYSLIPLQIYIKNGRAKLELALAKGKKLYDKRDDMAKKSAKRDMDRAKKANNN